MSDVTGKVFVVTGATGGIGEATARLLIDRGGQVLVTDLSQDSIDALVNRLGDRASGLMVDVSRMEANQAMIATAMDRFGRLDGVFLNAGIEGDVNAFEDQTEANWERVLAVNLHGVRFGAYAAAPALEQSGGGSIVMTSSVAGIRGAPNLSPYVTSKHAVIGLMRCLASEWGRRGIRVNTLNPGPVDNRMMRSIEAQSSPGHEADVKASFTQRIPMGRYVTNEECARMAMFLLSDQSSGMTGNTYFVDGGYCAG